MTAAAQKQVLDYLSGAAGQGPALTVAIGELANEGMTGNLLTGAYTLKASDDGKTFNCSVALTVTVPGSLLPKPSVTLIPPATGNLSIAATSPATINGAGTTLTRTRANNLTGVHIVGYVGGVDYGVGGA